MFYVIFLPMLKISFFFKLDRLKILKDIFKEDNPIVTTEISHNLIFLSILNLMPRFNNLKVWNFENLIEGSPNFVILQLSVIFT